MRTAAILTISDSAHQGTRSDQSGPAVRARLQQMGLDAAVEVIPDERELIALRLRTLADDHQVSAIFTTGGTGIAIRDVTPEATRDVIEREIPGLGEWMRTAGRQSVKTSILSRGLAGTRGKTLIINLPGSPKGAIESLDAIADVLPHALDLLEGKTEHIPGRKP